MTRTRRPEWPDLVYPALFLMNLAFVAMGIRTDPWWSTTISALCTALMPFCWLSVKRAKRRQALASGMAEGIQAAMREAEHKIAVSRAQKAILGDLEGGER